MNAPKRGRRLLPGFLLVGWILFSTGCVAPHLEAPLTVENGASAFATRSLSDPGLRAFVRENLGRDPDQWSFEELCWAGLYYQPALEVARAQWAEARAAQRTAAQRPNPTLSLTPGYDFTHQDGVSPWMPAVSLDLPIQTNDKRSLQNEIAAADAEAARLEVLSAVWRLRSDLRKALIEADTAAQRASLLKEQAEVQRRLLRLLEQRFAAGGVSATEVSVVRAALLRAEAATGEAENQAQAARVQVAVVIGLPVSALNGVTLPRVPGPVALSDEALAAARGAALRSRADVLQALAKYRSAHAALALETAKRLPDIHLGPGYQWDQGLSKWTLGITFEIPLFNQNQGPIAEAAARRAEASARFNQVQGDAIAAIDGAAASLRLALAQVGRTRQLFDEVQKQVGRAEQRFKLGAADQVELQSSYVDEAAVRGSMLDAESAAALAAGQLEDALQIPFPKMAALVDPARASAPRSL